MNLKLLRVCTLHKVESPGLYGIVVKRLIDAINRYLELDDCDSAVVELDGVLEMLSHFEPQPQSMTKAYVFFYYLPTLVQVGSVSNTVFDSVPTDLDNL